MEIPLKEDGSLDVERIEKLPLEERLELVACLNDEQLSSYVGDIPINDGLQPPIKAIHVDYGFDDERSGVDAYEFMEEMRQKYLSQRAHTTDTNTN